MARRSWRSFDYLLLGSLLLLSAYGVIMIYSATINTLGVEDSVQRQIIYVLSGTALLLVTASLDYRLLELVQHPFGGLTPLVMALTGLGATIIWRLGQLPDMEALPPGNVFVQDLPALLLGLLLVAAVYALDRIWIEKIDLVLTRLVAVLLAGGLAATLAVFALRLDPARLSTLTPFLVTTGLALLYLIDCLVLRISDIFRNPLYVIMLALLGTTFIIGQVAGGAQRWLGAGAIQPSELSKVIFIIVLAQFFADHEEQMEQFGPVLASLGILGIPTLLIYLQPDLGTALTLVAIWIAVVWSAGIRLRHLFAFIGTGVVALPLVWLNLEDYMKQRLLVFVNPASDPDSYFNSYHALVSIGSGGWVGKGFAQGTQSQLHFLRVRHTDFIFAVTAEELGFLGTVVMMALLVFILWRTLRVAEQSRDTFGRLIATGVAAVILFQSAVNIGMNLGLMPVTGIPLPFFSYGGSSFLTLMVSMGLVESVAMRHKKLEFD
ncbi:MAG: FtsW/RodA/SpoVE family cell cycle protein [Anaerolineae bacterium]|jgi:rod shape determining protein RodA